MTAWLGSGHPAQSVECPTCGAFAGRRCVATVPRWSEAPILGMHAERIAQVSGLASYVTHDEQMEAGHA